MCGAILLGFPPCGPTAAAALLQGPPATSQPSEPGVVRSGETEVQFNQGRVDYYQGKFTSAEAAFRNCLNANPQDAQSHYYLGLSLAGEDKPKDAIAEFNRTLDLDPTMNEARGGRASAQIRLGQYAAAQSDIDALAADPAYADTANYLRGQLAYAKGDYQAAAKSFGQAHAAGGEEASAAGLYEGLSYVQLKQLNRAQAALRDVARIDRDSSVGNASRAMDTSINVNANENKPFSFQIAGGMEYDSNVPLIQDSRLLPPGTKHQQDVRFVLQPRASWSIIRNDRVDAGIDTTDYFAWQSYDNDFDIASYGVGAFGNFRITRDLFAGVRYDFNYMEVGHDTFLNRNTVTPNVTYIEPRLGYTTGYYQFEARQFHEVPPTAALDRDSHNNVLGIVQGIDLPKLARNGMEAPRVEVGFRYENQSASGSDFDGNFFTLSGEYFTPLCRTCTGDVGVELSYFPYDNANSLDNAHDKRTDYEARPHVGITWQANRYIAVRGDYTYTYHYSNVQAGNVRPYAYDQHVVGVRVIFTY
jgi:tetratricopeptide (TPR) repeat protein